MNDKKFKPSMTATYFDFDYLSEEAKKYLKNNGFYLQDNERHFSSFNSQPVTASTFWTAMIVIISFVETYCY